MLCCLRIGTLAPPTAATHTQEPSPADGRAASIRVGFCAQMWRLQNAFKGTSNDCFSQTPPHPPITFVTLKLPSAGFERLLGLGLGLLGSRTALFKALSLLLALQTSCSLLCLSLSRESASHSLYYFFIRRKCVKLCVCFLLFTQFTCNNHCKETLLSNGCYKSVFNSYICPLCTYMLC